MRGLSLAAASGGHSSSRCTGLSLSRPLPLQSTGSRRAGSVVVVHRLSSSAACGIFPDQGANPCPLHWQADSQPLHHQGSPRDACTLRFKYVQFSVLLIGVMLLMSLCARKQILVLWIIPNRYTPYRKSNAWIHLPLLPLITFFK